MLYRGHLATAALVSTIACFSVPTKHRALQRAAIDYKQRPKIEIVAINKTEVGLIIRSDSTERSIALTRETGLCTPSAQTTTNSQQLVTIGETPITTIGDFSVVRKNETVVVSPPSGAPLTIKFYSKAQWIPNTDVIATDGFRLYLLPLQKLVTSERFALAGERIFVEEGEGVREFTREMQPGAHFRPRLDLLGQFISDSSEHRTLVFGNNNSQGYWLLSGDTWAHASSLSKTPSPVPWLGRTSLSHSWINTSQSTQEDRNIRVRRMGDSVEVEWHENGALKDRYLFDAPGDVFRIETTPFVVGRDWLLNTATGNRRAIVFSQIVRDGPNYLLRDTDGLVSQYSSSHRLVPRPGPIVGALRYSNDQWLGFVIPGWEIVWIFDTKTMVWQYFSLRDCR